MHEIWHTYNVEGALSNDANIVQTKYCFQGHIKGNKDKAQIMTTELTLKTMSNGNDFGVIR